MFKLECVVESCSKKAEIQQDDIATSGWKRVSKSASAPTKRLWRTHLGWCPECTTKYGVLNPSEEPVEEVKK